MFVGPGDQTGRPYIRRLVESFPRHTIIVNCPLSIVNCQLNRFLAESIRMKMNSRMVKPHSEEPP